MDVYNDLGPGFLENVYQEAMEIEVAQRQFPLTPAQEIHIQYKGRPLRKFYIADLVCYKKIIVEIKAMDKLTIREEGKLINYLKATGMKVGVLINFGHYPNLECGNASCSPKSRISVRQHAWYGKSPQTM